MSETVKSCNIILIICTEWCPFRHCTCKFQSTWCFMSPFLATQTGVGGEAGGGTREKKGTGSDLRN